MYKQTASFYEVPLFILERPSKGKIAKSCDASGKQLKFMSN